MSHFTSLRRGNARHRLAALLVATALSPALMPLLPLDHSGPGISQALAKENVLIEKIEIPVAFGTITLNQVSVTGSSLSKADIEALFRANSLNGLAAKLETFDADRMAIRSIVMTVKAENNGSTTTYENIEASPIRKGVIEKIVQGSGRFDSKTRHDDKEIVVNGTMGRVTVDALDRGAGMRWLTEADPTGKAPFKRVHGRYVMDSIKISSGDLFTADIGKIEGDYFEVRPTRRPFGTMYGDLIKAEGKKDDPTTSANVFAALLEFQNSYRFGFVTAAGVKADIKTPEGNGTLSMGPMTLRGTTDQGMKLEKFELKMPDGFMRIGEIGSKGDVYGVMLTSMARALLLGLDSNGKNGADKKPMSPESRAALEAAAADASAGLQGKDATVYVAGIEADLPPGKGAKNPERVKFSLGGFESTVGGFIGITPTKLGLGLKKFVMALPATTTDTGIQTLKDIGLEKLDLSAGIAANWTEPGSKLSITDISVDIDKLAKVALKGELAGVPRAFFESPTTNWPMLLSTGNVQRIDIAVADRGGLDKVLAKTAKDQGKTADQFRMELAGIAPAMIAGVLAGHPDAAKLAQAVGTFLQSLKGLDVAAISASPAGITVPEIMAASNNPMMLLPKVKFEASAK